jgi:hypothetical protein
MKRLLTKNLNRIFTMFFLGVLSMSTAARSDQPHNLTITDPKEAMQVTFAHPPTHMFFDIPVKEHMGNLNVYLAPFEKEIWMCCSLALPPFTGKQLEENFSQIFYSHIIQRMFYSPQVFKKENFSKKNIQFEGYPAVRFSTTYQDNQVEHLLSGIAIIRENKLYILFYATLEESFNEQALQTFVQSFHFIK